MDGGFSSRRRNHAFVSHRRDAFVEWLKHMLLPHFELQNMDEIGPYLALMEDLIEEHRKDVVHSRLRRLVPTIGTFFTPLPLAEAFDMYNSKYQITSRKFIPPSFNELRHILNLSQVLAFTKDPLKLGLITFDGDQTLYPDQKNFEDLELGRRMLTLLECGVHIAVVTAASYETDAKKYEFRLQSFFNYLKRYGATKETCNRFWVLGGECNYLFQLQENFQLRYSSEDMVEKIAPNQKQSEMLDIVEKTMTEAMKEMKIKGRILRKIMSCGLISVDEENLRRECLDECCLRIQDDVLRNNVAFPYCAFNGGNDVWFDIGNKRVGIERLQKKFNVAPKNCLHVGDQLLVTGNDFAARSCSPVTWITSPTETKKILSLILREVYEIHDPDLFTPRADSKQLPPTLNDGEAHHDDKYDAHAL